MASEHAVGVCVLGAGDTHEVSMLECLKHHMLGCWRHPESVLVGVLETPAQCTC